MSNLLKHIKVSAVGDSGDATLIQPSDWNNGHKFTGGSTGQVLIRDATDSSFGAAWTSVPILGAVQFTFGTPAVLVDGMAWLEVSGTSPSRTLSMNVREGGVTRVAWSTTY